ncbi:hypothetical protein ACTA71_009128 [Dictyostelium dimigraforme]
MVNKKRKSKEQKKENLQLNPLDKDKPLSPVMMDVKLFKPPPIRPISNYPTTTTATINNTTLRHNNYNNNNNLCSAFNNARCKSKSKPFCHIRISLVSISIIININNQPSTVNHQISTFNFNVNRISINIYTFGIILTSPMKDKN